MKGHLIPICLLALPLHLNGQNAQFQSTWSALIEEHQVKLEKVGIVGNGIVFMKDGKLVEESMNGFQDLSKRTPITINTIYNWASCTKMFTALAIMQLRDKGQLDLSDFASSYVPAIKNISSDFKKDFTIKEVLSHTSGLPRLSKTTRLIDGNFYETQEREKYLEKLSEAVIQSEPGSKYTYSNFGYDILGLVIEEISGLSYKKYIADNILKPLGMKNSFFDELPAEIAEFRSDNYRGHRGKLYSKAKDFDNPSNTGLDHPSGGLNAPFTDMMLFIDFLYGMDSLNNEVLKYSSLQEMFAVRNTVHTKMKNGEGHDHFIGLGFNIINPNTYRLIGHEGESFGFMSSLWVNPETRIGYLFAWNTTHRLPNKKDEKLYINFNRAVYERLYPLLIEGL